MAVPKTLDIDPADLLKQRIDLPFIRFNPLHMIGKQVAAHLARNRIDFLDRFSFDSVQSIMAVVASGEGWSLITPMGFMRGQRFANSVRLHPLQIAAFSRTIAITARSDFDTQIVQAIATVLRQIVNSEVVAPACVMYPWLTDRFSVFHADI